MNHRLILTSILIISGISNIAYGQIAPVSNQTTSYCCLESPNQTNNPIQNVTSPSYFKCMDSVEQNMKTKYASFDEEQAKTVSVSYDKFQSEVKTDNYTFVAVSAEWKNDQVNCDVMFEHALVRFNVFNATGIQRDVTVIVDPVSYQPTGIVVEHDMPTHGGVVTLSPLKQLHSGIKPENIQCNPGFSRLSKYSGDGSACIKNEDVKHFMESRSWGKMTVIVATFDVRQ